MHAGVGDVDLASISASKMKVNQVNPPPFSTSSHSVSGQRTDEGPTGYQLKQKPGYHSESNVQNPLDNCLID